MSFMTPILSGRCPSAKASRGANAMAAPPSRMSLRFIIIPPVELTLRACRHSRALFDLRQPAQQRDERPAALGAEEPHDRLFLFALHGAGARDKFAARTRQDERVRTAVGIRAQTLGEAAPLEFVHHRDEVGPLDAEGAGDFRLLAAG